ncbi:unnamed protein product [Polarella glacialis]|uniref:Uncharacterized protein n=1 Tax=Polarella glacialis TaxID=89957 RepID=A0A813JJV3_POLGL|nr:unnamed protein product [Polarella glacialis]
MGTTMQSQDCDNMTKMLQTKLRPDVPCMVCDINTGQVLIANFHADDLFESSAATGRLIDHDLISLIAPEDRDKVIWHGMRPCQNQLGVYPIYLTPTARFVMMDTQRVHIQTLTGCDPQKAEALSPRGGLTAHRLLVAARFQFGQLHQLTTAVEIASQSTGSCFTPEGHTLASVY